MEIGDKVRFKDDVIRQTKNQRTNDKEIFLFGRTHWIRIRAIKAMKEENVFTVKTINRGGGVELIDRNDLQIGYYHESILDMIYSELEGAEEL